MIRLNKGTKTFGKGNAKVAALVNVDFEISKGEFLVILGASGSGKSTLLNVVSTIDSIDQGELYFNEKNISNLNEKAKTKFRREHVGFIFQQYYLLENLTVKENILTGAYLNNSTDIESLVDALELKEFVHKYPYELSGGQQQRVAIARAVSKNPDILICDEPTGALDEQTGKLVLSYLEKINEQFGTTVVMVTHSPGISKMATRIVKMNSGKIIEIIDNKNRVPASEVYWG